MTTRERRKPPPSSAPRSRPAADVPYGVLIQNNAVYFGSLQVDNGTSLAFIPANSVNWTLDQTSPAAGSGG